MRTGTLYNYKELRIKQKSVLLRETLFFKAAVKGVDNVVFVGA